MKYCEFYTFLIFNAPDDGIPQRRPFHERFEKIRAALSFLMALASVVSIQCTSETDRRTDTTQFNAHATRRADKEQ